MNPATRVDLAFMKWEKGVYTDADMKEEIETAYTDLADFYVRLPEDREGHTIHVGDVVSDGEYCFRVSSMDYGYHEEHEGRDWMVWSADAAFNELASDVTITGDTPDVLLKELVKAVDKVRSEGGSSDEIDELVDMYARKMVMRV